MENWSWSDREIETAIEATFSKLGYPAANPEQLEAVKEFVKGKDVFVSTLTGSGKSLCYGSLPLVFDLLRSGSTVTRRKIISSLSMPKCHVISRNPCKPNIYIVRPKTTVEEVFAPIVDDIQVNKQTAQRTIIFCRNFREWFDIFHYFRMQLKLDKYYPPTAPHLSKYRLVDMFTSVTDESVKTNIIRNFTSPNGHWVTRKA